MTVNRMTVAPAAIPAMAGLESLFDGAMGAAVGACDGVDARSVDASEIVVERTEGGVPVAAAIDVSVTV